MASRDPPFRVTQSKLTLIDRVLPGADLDLLPSSSGGRSEFSGNFMQFLFIEKSENKIHVCLSIYPSVTICLSVQLVS